MALPTLQRKLFQNSGYGPLLKDEIVSRHISVQDWSNAYDYPVATVVRGSDGLLYCSVAQSGPGVAAGAQDPTADDGTYWSSPSVKTVAASDSSNASASTEWVKQWDVSQKIPNDLYLDPVNGDDANSGFSAAQAKKTIPAMLNFIKSTNRPVSLDTTIHFAPGTYSDRLEGIPGTSLNLLFEDGAIIPSMYCNSSFLHIYGTLQVKDITTLTRGSVVTVGNNFTLKFNNYSKTHFIRAYMGAILTSEVGSVFNMSFTNCTVSTAAFSVFDNATFSFLGPISFTGSFTGKRYSATTCSGFDGFGSQTAIPGTVAGTIDATSYYR